MHEQNARPMHEQNAYTVYASYTSYASSAWYARHIGRGGRGRQKIHGSCSGSVATCNGEGRCSGLGGSQKGAPQAGLVPIMYNFLKALVPMSQPLSSFRAGGEGLGAPCGIRSV